MPPTPRLLPAISRSAFCRPRPSMFSQPRRRPQSPALPREPRHGAQAADSLLERRVSAEELRQAGGRKWIDDEEVRRRRACIERKALIHRLQLLERGGERE